MECTAVRASSTLLVMFMVCTALMAGGTHVVRVMACSAVIAVVIDMYLEVSFGLKLFLL